MNEVILDKPQRYSYATYLTWIDDKRRELLDGFIHLMSPAPKCKHQEISSDLNEQLLEFRKKVGKEKFRVFYAPFDVRLPQTKGQEDKDIYTVVQPDICVICDLSKLDERGCLGAPDIMVEIISPSSKKYDLNDKFNIYERSGVREYWIVDPYAKTIDLYFLQPNGKYDTGIVYELEENAIVKSMVLEGLAIELKDVFS